MKKSSRAENIYLGIFLYLPVAWIALLVAQSMGENIIITLKNLMVAVQNPFNIIWTDASLSTLLIFTLVYVVGIAIYTTEKKRTRLGEEHGSAIWANPRQVNAMFMGKKNKLLTKNVRLGLNAHKHKRNLNVLVIGGSGASKTRGYFVAKRHSVNNVAEYVTVRTCDDEKELLYIKHKMYNNVAGLENSISNINAHLATLNAMLDCFDLAIEKESEGLNERK